MPSSPRPSTRRTVLKTFRKTFRLSPGERETLRRNASAAGLSLSTYVRRVALGQKVRARRRFVDQHALYQLSQIRKNLEQLRRVIDTGGGDDQVWADVVATVEELREVWDGLKVDPEDED